MPSPDQEPKSVKTKIIEAIQRNDLASLEAELRNANTLLTGFDHAHFATAAKDELNGILSQLLTDAKQGDARETVYLGDGGSSRIMLRVVDDQTTVELTNNSHPEVKQKWAGLQ